MKFSLTFNVLTGLLLLATRLASAQVAPPELGAAAHYGLLSGSSAQSIDPIYVAGSIGAAQSLSATLTASDSTFANGGGDVVTALADAQAARAECTAVAGQTTLTTLNGQSLSGGVYALSSTTLAAGTPLVLTGDTSSVYIFNISGSLTLAAAAVVDLGQVRAGHVYWNVQGSLQVGISAAIAGTMLVGGAATVDGECYGSHAILAAGAVQLGAADVLVGWQNWAAPRYLSAVLPISTPPAAPTLTCANNGNLLQNEGFESGFCGPLNGPPPNNNPLPDFMIDGQARGHVDNWLGFSSPDWWVAQILNCRTIWGTAYSTESNLANQPAAGTTIISLPARTGTHYAGVYALQARPATATAPAYPEGREYIMQRLAQPLLPNRRYYAEYFASLAPASRSVLNRLQIALASTVPVPAATSAVLTAPAVMVVASNTNLPTGITNPVTGGRGLGWTQISGAFTPTAGNLQVLLIGNFIANDVVVDAGPAGTNPVAYPANSDGIRGAYYYIDDVLLAPFPGAGPGGTIVCGNTFQLASPDCLLPTTSGATYQWTVNGTAVAPASTLTEVLTVSPTVTTTYTLTVTAAGQTYSSTTIVYVMPRTSGSQTVACGSSITLPTCGGVAPPGTVLQWGSSPNDPTLNNSVQNPTVTPPGPPFGASPITYTYTLITNNGGQIAQSTTQITVQPCPPDPCDHKYTLNPANTYHNPKDGKPTEIGDPKKLTILTGNTVFDGIYHLLGPVELQKGKFTINPGTIFYIDGGTGFPNNRLACYARELAGYLRIVVGNKAVLTISGATLTSTCNRMWGGIEVVDNGRLVTEKSFGGKQKYRTYINQARVGILAGCNANNVDGTYRITGTSFENDNYGLAALGNRRRMSPDECQVYDCKFFSDLTARLAPERNTFTKVGMVLRGAYHETIPYHYNSFGSLLVGADIGGNNATFDFNQFADCYGTALRAGGPDVYDPLDYVLLSDNTIDIPAAQNPGGQVPANAEVKGIELPRLGVQGAAIQVFHNQIGSLTRPGNVFKVKVGLDAQLFFYETDIMERNAFSGLDHGVRLFDAAGTYPYQVVSNNTFDTFTNGITLTGTQNAPFSPTLACNNLSNGNRGIYIVGAVGTAGPAQVGDLGTPSETCGNYYDRNVSTSVQNDGAYATFTYYAQSSPPENVFNPIPGTSGGTVRSYAGNDCISRGATYGLRPSGGSSATVQDVEDWQQQLLQNTGDPKVLHALEFMAVDYYFGAGQLSDLETFVNQLPLNNDAAFERLSLYLMETYRQQGQPSDAQRVRDALLAQRGSFPEVAHRVAYFDLAARLGQLGAGEVPVPADSTLLVDLANAPTAYAPVACATLRYYYPELSCGNEPTSASPGARPATTQRTVQLTNRVSLRAYPNPATETVTFTANGPVPAGVRLELVALATGRVVRTLPTGQTAGNVVVTGLAPGVYAGRLVDAEQVLSTCKVVILH